MTFKLTVKCDLVCGFLRCDFPMDTIDVDLKVCTLKGILTCKKDYKTQIKSTNTSDGELKFNHTPALKEI